MNNNADLKTQIATVVETLSSEQVVQVWEFLEQLASAGSDADSSHFAEASVAYHVDQPLLRSKMAPPTVAEMTVPQLEGMIYDVMERVLFETSYDPDEGLELREDFIEKLERAQKEIEAGEVYTFEEVVKELGFDL